MLGGGGRKARKTTPILRLMNVCTRGDIIMMSKCMRPKHGKLDRTTSSMWTAVGGSGALLSTKAVCVRLWRHGAAVHDE